MQRNEEQERPREVVLPSVGLPEPHNVPGFLSGSNPGPLLIGRIDALGAS